MFPIFWNSHYLKSNGDITTIGDEIGSGGGGGDPVLEPLTVTENGTYRPGAGVDGFNRVTVNVSGGIPTITRSEWDSLTTSQKQSYGLTVIVDSDTGFLRGEYVNGEDYTLYNIDQEYDCNTELNVASDNECTINFETVATSMGGEGFILSYTMTPVRVRMTIIEVDNSVQFGICTQDAELPGIVRSGTGRVYYSTGTTGSSFTQNLSAGQKIFVGSASSSITTGSIKVEIITD